MLVSVPKDSAITSCISIGVDNGGPEANATRVDRAVMRAMNLVVEEGAPGDDSDFSEPEVNVVFHLDGSICPNEFEGIRTGRLWRPKKIMMVQVAVGYDHFESPDAVEFVIDALRSACHLAVPYLRKAGLEFPLNEALSLADRVVARLKDEDKSFDDSGWRFSAVYT